MTDLSNWSKDAWIVHQWAIDRRPQVDIATDLGHHSSSYVCSCISSFINRWYTKSNVIYNKRLWAEKALENYAKAGGTLIKPEMGHPTHPYWDIYYKAAQEHAFLLRCEGLTYRQISIRLGVSIERGRQKVIEHSRTMKRAMSRTKFYWIEQSLPAAVIKTTRKICPQCNNEFTRNNITYCSNKCRLEKQKIFGTRGDLAKAIKRTYPGWVSSPLEGETKIRLDKSARKRIWLEEAQKLGLIPKEV